MSEHYDSLSLDWRICQVMLLVNAVWDIISCLCIWLSFCITDVQQQSFEPVDESTTSNNESISLLDFIRCKSMSSIRDLGYWKAMSLSIAEMHTSMWARKTDAFNHAACMLMGWLVLTFGLIRFLAFINHQFISLAAISYAIEGLFFLVEAVKSTMVPKKSCYASIFCFVCLVICVIKIPPM